MGGTVGQKTALITGITGQDGAYLAEFLLKKGYIVHGIKRRSSSFNTQRIDHLFKDPHSEGADRFILHHGDMTDTSSLSRIIEQSNPDEIYNLAAQSHVAVSFEEPEYTANSDALGVLRILEIIRNQNLISTVKFYQASTSELYGLVQEVPQREATPFYPRSPYAVAKLYAYWITINYRESYGMFATNGILFNHESPKRGETFVTRKITMAAARIAIGLQDKIYIGNLNAKRDWGHARDFVEAMWLILQKETPKDYVIATGHQLSVREFMDRVFELFGIRIEWLGSGVDEKGIVASIEEPSGLLQKFHDMFDLPKKGDVIISVDSKYFRPTEVDSLLGDASKARQELNWMPRTEIAELVEEMVYHDMCLAVSDAAAQAVRDD